MRFREAVEAARLGYVTARNAKAAARWRAQLQAKQGGALKGVSLDAQVRVLAAQNPDRVKLVN